MNEELKKLLEWHQENANELEGEQGEEDNFAFHNWAVETLKRSL